MNNFLLLLFLGKNLSTFYFGLDSQGPEASDSQPGGTDYAHLINTGTPGFSNLPTALKLKDSIEYSSDSPF